MAGCFAGLAGDHRRADRCTWQSVDGYGCNFAAGHAGWHERHIRPECPCNAAQCPGPYCRIVGPHAAGSAGCAYRRPSAATVSPFVARALAGRLPAKVIR